MDRDRNRMCERRGGTRSAWSVAVAGLACALVLGAELAAAATINVTTTADENSSTPTNLLCSLREAVIAANTDLPVGACPAGGHGLDTIVLPAGTYTLTIGGGGEDAAETGDLDVLGATTIQGAGSGSTVVDGNAIDRVVHVVSGAAVTLTGLTLRGGTMQALAASSPSNVSLTNVVVESNQDIGVRNDGVMSITDSTVRNNPHGGILNGGDLTLTRVLVENNTVTSGPGGVVENWGILSIVQSTIRNNTSTVPTGGFYVGAGLLTVSADAALTDTTIENNAAVGILALCYGLDCYAGDLSLERSTVSGNSGGGVVSLGTRATIRNSTISTNGTGGIQTVSSLFDMTNVTLTGNSGLTIDNSLYGGLYGPAIVKLSNTIIDGDCVTDPNNVTTSLGGNLESPGNTCALTAGGDQVNVADPKIGPLAMNGGLTKTHALLAGSPAIGHGNDAACPATDQRGVTRPAPAGGHCDVGSYEYNTGCGASLEATGAAPLALLLARRRRRSRR